MKFLFGYNMKNINYWWKMNLWCGDGVEMINFLAIEGHSHPSSPIWKTLWGVKADLKRFSKSLVAETFPENKLRRNFVAFIQFQNTISNCRNFLYRMSFQIMDNLL